MMDFSGKKKSVVYYCYCSKKLFEVKNTTVKYKWFLVRKWFKHFFLYILKKSHILKYGSRYGMFGEESHLVVRYKYTKNWNYIGHDLRKRRWYEYIFIINR